MFNCTCSSTFHSKFNLHSSMGRKSIPSQSKLELGHKYVHHASCTYQVTEFKIFWWMSIIRESLMVKEIAEQKSAKYGGTLRDQYCLPSSTYQDPLNP